MTMHLSGKKKLGQWAMALAKHVNYYQLMSNGLAVVAVTVVSPYQN